MPEERAICRHTWGEYLLMRGDSRIRGTDVTDKARCEFYSKCRWPQPWGRRRKSDQAGGLTPTCRSGQQVRCVPKPHEVKLVKPPVLLVRGGHWVVTPLVHNLVSWVAVWEKTRNTHHNAVQRRLSARVLEKYIYHQCVVSESLQFKWLWR